MTSPPWRRGEYFARRRFTATRLAPTQAGTPTRPATGRSGEYHDLRHAIAALKLHLRAMAMAGLIGMVLAFALGRAARAEKN